MSSQDALLRFPCHEQCIDNRTAFRMHDDRVEVDLFEIVAQCVHHGGEACRNRAKCVDIRRRPSSDSVEHRPQLQTVDTTSGMSGIKRRQSENDIVKYFHEHAAESEHDDRSELRITLYAKIHLHPLLRHRCNDDVSAES